MEHTLIMTWATILRLRLYLNSRPSKSKAQYYEARRLIYHAIASKITVWEDEA